MVDEHDLARNASGCALWSERPGTARRAATP